MEILAKEGCGFRRSRRKSGELGVKEGMKSSDAIMLQYCIQPLASSSANLSTSQVVVIYMSEKPAMDVLKFMAHDTELVPLGSFQAHERFFVQTSLALPLQDGFEILALMINARVRERALEGVGRDVCIDICIRTAHDVL